MRYIAHRGVCNTNMIFCPRVLENSISAIEGTLYIGYDAEVDVRYGEIDSVTAWRIGHDYPCEEVSIDWLNNPKLWIHAKDIRTFYKLVEIRQDYPLLNFFFHDSDDMSITSKGYLWTLYGKELTPKSIIMAPSHVSAKELIHTLRYHEVAGVCSDRIGEIKQSMGDNG